MCSMHEYTRVVQAGTLPTIFGVYPVSQIPYIIKHVYLARRSKTREPHVLDVIVAMNSF